MASPCWTLYDCKGSVLYKTCTLIERMSSSICWASAAFTAGLGLCRHLTVKAGGHKNALLGVAELESHLCDVLTHVCRQIVHCLSVQLVLKLGAKLTNDHGKDNLQTHSWIESEPHENVSK